MGITTIVICIIAHFWVANSQEKKHAEKEKQKIEQAQNTDSLEGK